MRVLLIEDEFLVATAVEAVLFSLGHEVVGSAATVDAALAALDRGPSPDAAILDLNLRGQPSLAVAQELARRHIPFVFASGYERDEAVGKQFPAAQWLRKPYTDKQINATL
ncbi:MAG: response regulator, partial [Alphaproteobacteria bacterium]|nr:response regulator [Alphaproteobacteria bacterium]